MRFALSAVAVLVYATSVSGVDGIRPNAKQIVDTERPAYQHRRKAQIISNRMYCNYIGGVLINPDNPDDGCLVHPRAATQGDCLVQFDPGSFGCNYCEEADKGGKICFDYGCSEIDCTCNGVIWEGFDCGPCIFTLLGIDRRIPFGNLKYDCSAIGGPSSREDCIDPDQLPCRCGKCTFNITEGGVLQRTPAPDGFPDRNPCPDCSWISITDRNVRNLPANTFEGMNTLDRLELSNNAIETLPTGIFKELPNLFWLALDRNRIASLPPGIFNKSTAIQVLDISYNNISTLPAGVFGKMTVLKNLDISHNNITTIPLGSFDRLGSLQFLDLSSNSLEKLWMGSFGGLKELESLDLSLNPISYLEDGVFSYLNSLEKLILCNKYGGFHGSISLAIFTPGRIPPKICMCIHNELFYTTQAELPTSNGIRFDKETLTVWKEYWESLETWCGDFVITHSRKRSTTPLVVSLPSLRAISGSIIIHNTNLIGSVILPNLNAVEGQLVVTNNKNLELFSASWTSSGEFCRTFKEATITGNDGLSIMQPPWLRPGRNKTTGIECTCPEGFVLVKRAYSNRYECIKDFWGEFWSKFFKPLVVPLACAWLLLLLQTWWLPGAVDRFGRALLDSGPTYIATDIFAASMTSNGDSDAGPELGSESTVPTRHCDVFCSRFMTTANNDSLGPSSLADTNQSPTEPPVEDRFHLSECLGFMSVFVFVALVTAALFGAIFLILVFVPFFFAWLLFVSEGQHNNLAGPAVQDEVILLSERLGFNRASSIALIACILLGIADLITDILFITIFNSCEKLRARSIFFVLLPSGMLLTGACFAVTVGVFAPERLKMQTTSHTSRLRLLCFASTTINYSLQAVLDMALSCLMVCFCAAEMKAISLLPWTIDNVPKERMPAASSETQALPVDPSRPTQAEIQGLIARVETEKEPKDLQSNLERNDYFPDWQLKRSLLRIWMVVWSVVEDIAQIYIQLTFLSTRSGKDGCYPSYGEATGTTVSIVFSFLRLFEQLAWMLAFVWERLLASQLLWICQDQHFDIEGIC